MVMVSVVPEKKVLSLSIPLYGAVPVSLMFRVAVSPGHIPLVPEMVAVGSELTFT